MAHAYAGALLGVLLASLAGALFIAHVATQRNAMLLAGLGLVTLLYLAPHGLVEPRYYIVPFLLAGWLSDFSPREAALLTRWYQGLCVVVCASVLSGTML